jgi:hypothetical protein
MSAAETVEELSVCSISSVSSNGFKIESFQRFMPFHKVFSEFTTILGQLYNLIAVIFLDIQALPAWISFLKQAML